MGKNLGKEIIRGGIGEMLKNREREEGGIGRKESKRKKNEGQELTER